MKASATIARVPKMPSPETPEVYRLGLRLDHELGERLKEAAWQARQSVQAYVEQAIRERIQADETTPAKRKP